MEEKIGGNFFILPNKLFGTDGVRGIVNKTLLPETAYKIGRAISFLYDNSIDKIKVVVGHDTRISSDMLENALISGLLSSGANVERLGIIPTAGVSYLSKILKANAGVMITASHNDATFNGIKIFNGNGYKLTKMQQMQIEELVSLNNMPLAENNKIGQIKDNKKAAKRYIDYLVKNASGFFNDLNICLDCANGAGRVIAPKVLKKLGVNLTVIHNSKNGLLINKNCGATSLNSLIEVVKKSNFDLGLSLDGDADRLMIVDEKGRVISGEVGLFLFSQFLKESGKLKNNKIATTVISNYALIKELNKKNINVCLTSVGDENVIEAILKSDLSFGGESSGHYIFENEVTTADGILASVYFLNCLKSKNFKLGKILDEFTLFPQVSINVEVKENKKQEILNDKKLKEIIEECETILKNEGRILVRASGTESVIRIMVEGKDLEEAKMLASKIENVVKSISN